MLSALGDAMPVLSEAMVLRTVSAASAYEAREMFLLAELQTGRINDSIRLGGARAYREARA